MYEINKNLESLYLEREAQSMSIGEFRVEIKRGVSRAILPYALILFVLILLN